mmetsp:Transcript_12519/g.18908  ORF Transcript_12519/g.18908 Transcript_12519/m.18908 type:complete len:205 (+) Transcript_12519:82-696(+)
MAQWKMSPVKLNNSHRAHVIEDSSGYDAEVMKYTSEGHDKISSSSLLCTASSMFNDDDDHINDAKRDSECNSTGNRPQDNELITIDLQLNNSTTSDDKEVPLPREKRVSFDISESQEDSFDDVSQFVALREAINKPAAEAESSFESNEIIFSREFLERIEKEFPSSSSRNQLDVNNISTDTLMNLVMEKHKLLESEGMFTLNSE